MNYKFALQFEMMLSIYSISVRTIFTIFLNNSWGNIILKQLKKKTEEKEKSAMTSAFTQQQHPQVNYVVVQPGPFSPQASSIIYLVQKPGFSQEGDGDKLSYF